MNNTPSWTVTHNAAQSRFEATVDGQLSEAAYRLNGDVMTMTHTSVPPALEGRGIAASLVEKAIAHAREQGLKIEPQCAYVAAYMQRHPEAKDVLA
ncbi:GNAT family N-acetyltransferase [Ideonella sp. BN130291]|uniref:GNAT family N-acetyltransferase n=1 Tax=Ideonella sp. BN130291 TaxID=3112940 RepID=UPI002E25F9BD|nr:GNAT family N-acetyltransferase [Ideonella sp. BN130291]